MKKKKLVYLFKDLDDLIESSSPELAEIYRRNRTMLDFVWSAARVKTKEVTEASDERVG